MKIVGAHEQHCLHVTGTDREPTKNHKFYRFSVERRCLSRSLSRMCAEMRPFTCHRSDLQLWSRVACEHHFAGEFDAVRMRIGLESEVDSATRTFVISDRIYRNSCRQSESNKNHRTKSIDCDVSAFRWKLFIYSFISAGPMPKRER